MSLLEYFGARKGGEDVSDVVIISPEGLERREASDAAFAARMATFDDRSDAQLQAEVSRRTLSTCGGYMDPAQRRIMNQAILAALRP